MNKSRLIDANEAKDIIRYAQELTEWQAKEACDCIDCCDTAYDVDKITEMENEIEELRIITGLMQKRTYYRKFVDEIWKKQMGNELSEPDFDFIYKLYFEMIEQRNKVVGQLEALPNIANLIDREDAVKIVKGGGE